MLFKLAFRNVLRNKKRSFLTALTIFFAALIVGLAQSWVDGMGNVYIENLITYQTGLIRVTTNGYLKRQKFLPVDELIPNSKELINKIKKIAQVKSVNERIRFGILIGKEDRTVEAIGMGIDLNDNIFQLNQKIIEGSFSGRGIYIGYKLAKKLRVKLGEDLLIATKTSEGGLNGIKLKVMGIFKLNMILDKKLFFISLKDAKRLLKIYNGTTEIYIYGKDRDTVDELNKKVQDLLPKRNKEKILLLSDAKSILNNIVKNREENFFQVQKTINQASLKIQKDELDEANQLINQAIQALATRKDKDEIDKEYQKEIDLLIQKLQEARDLEVIIAQTYQKQLGGLYETFVSMKKIYAFVGALILFLASFVIINTMMMAIFERIREIGTLKAMGMTNRELFFNFTFEGAILGAVGGIPGAFFGFIIILILSKVGINFSSQLESFDMPFEFIVRPVVNFINLFIAVLLSIIVPARTAMIPAHYIKKLMPAEALRK